MILAITLTKNADYALYPLIEKLAPIYLPVTRLPGNRYYYGHSLAPALGLTPEQLLDLAYDSKRIHAVELPSGAFYVHPDGIDRMVTRKAQKVLLKLMKAC